MSDGRATSRATWRAVGSLVMVAGIGCFALGGPLFVHTLEFAERHLSRDQHISVQTIENLHRLLTALGPFLLALGVLAVVLSTALSKLTSRLIAVYSGLTNRRFSLVLLWCSSVVGLILAVFWLLKAVPGIGLLYGEDRLLKTLTAVLLAGSAVLLLMAAMRHRKQSSTQRSVVVALLGGIAGMLLVFSFEEISWGQRLFGIRTPAVLQRVNDQGELNIHNISNKLLLATYQWGTLAFTLLVAAGWLWVSRFEKSKLRFLLPHAATVGLLLLMLFFGTVCPGPGELLEELGAFFALFYALTVWRAARLRHNAT